MATLGLGVLPAARRQWLAPLSVFLVALALRLIYFAEIDEIPFVEFPLVDAKAYDEWAQRIAAGAWLGDEAFYQAPLYPYLLAVIYALFGRDLGTVHVLQMFLGAGSCLLMYAATRSLFGAAVALAAGLMLAVYPPAIFFDGIIGKQGLGLFLLLALVGLLLAHQRAPSGWRCAAAGLVLALLALTRENALALAAAIPVWLWLRFDQRSRAERLGHLLAFSAGLASLLLAVGLRNQIVGDTFALTTSQLGTNFYMGNNAEATGLYVPLLPGRHTPVYEASDAQLLAERELDRPLDRGEVSAYWLARGLDFVREHPGRWLALLGKKVALTWNEFEIADAEDIHVYADWSRLLRWLLPLWHFGVLAPLAAAGVVLAWNERRDFWLLGWLALVYTLSVALFITFARFRYPLVPMLMPLAALALVRAAGLARAGRAGELAGPAIAIVAALVLVNWPILDEDRFLLASYANLGGIMLNNDRVAEAEPFLERALAAGAQNADLQFHMAVLRFKQQRLEQAEQHLLQMLALQQDDHRGHLLLAKVYRDMGREREAFIHAKLAHQLNPDPDKRGRRSRRQLIGPGAR